MRKDRCLLWLFIVLLFIINLNLLECRRSGGSGGRKPSSRVTTRSPSRTTTYRSAQRATTSRYNIQTQQAYPNYNQPNYNQPAYNQPNAARVTTPRYNIQTHQSYPNYNQPGYNQPHYNQPGYNQPHYNQPGYNQPHYNQPGYNQPHYNQPGYNQPFPNNNNYYSSGVWQQKKDHGVRNSVLAGLGGSALGLYLGYKLGGLSNSANNPQYIGGPGGSPQYSVVHHYHHGDRPIPKEGKVEASVIKTCDNVTFCTANTTPLCMTNGTIYCIASLDSTIICNENSTELRCVNSTITLPCDNATSCNGTSLNTTSISIPCVTTIDVFGDFGSNKLSVNKISKRAAENDAIITTEGSSTSSDNNSTSAMTTTPSTDVNMTSSTTTAAPSISMALQSTSNNPSSALTRQGISNKYCVTVIAEPIKEPEVPSNLSNEEFAKYVQSNEALKNEANGKWSEVGNSIVKYVLS